MDCVGAPGAVKYVNVEAEPPKSKEIVTNDIANTGTVAALVGGFALSTMQGGHAYDLEESYTDNFSYLLLVFAVHACTCSALTSCILYRHINFMPDSAVPEWSSRNYMLLVMPFAKFGSARLGVRTRPARPRCRSVRSVRSVRWKRPGG
jgi:cytochrome bd-type quinol oxidase subunit 2